MTSAADPVQRLLDLLDGVRQTGPTQWQARCPGHDDQHASLSIGRGDDGRALVHCHASCALGDVLAKIGWSDGDLFPPDPAGKTSPRPPKPPGLSPAKAHRAGSIYKTPEAAFAEVARRTKAQFVGAWQYPGDTFRVGRFDFAQIDPDTGKPKKTFRPICRAGDGWIIGDPPGLLPLYRGDDLPAAGPIIVCEGEKKTDDARSVGLYAVTSAHGCGSAHKTDWRPLAGREIIILPDNDKGGRKYAQEVAAILTALGCVVRIVELPNLSEHGDFADWIEADGPMGCKSAEEIKAAVLDMASKATPWAPPPALVPTTAADWPDPRPLPAELPPVAAFDYALLPEAFRPWIEDIAARTQCPPDFPAVGAMVALAGIAGRKIGIRPKRFDDWLVVPNLWGAVIGRPGIMKTPALRQPLRPLQRLEIEAKAEFDQQAKEYEAAKMVAELTRNEREKDVRKAIRDGGNALAIATGILSEETPAPIRQRYLVNDSSVEKLGELLNENPNGLTVYRDELVGLLRSLDREGQEGTRAFYLEAWDGAGRFTYDRIGRGTIDIEAATVSIIGGIQPGRLAEYLRAAVKGGADDDGLIQRFQLTVWPDVESQWRNVDRWPDTPAKDTAFAVFARLNALDPLVAGAELDQQDPNGIPYLRFADEAQNVFDGWRAGLEKKIRSGDEHPAMESHLAKYRSLIPSLALLVHLADGTGGPVGTLALGRAIRWGEYLESHARRMYSLAANPDLAAGKALARKIQAGNLPDSFALRDIYRNGWSGLSDLEDAERAVSLLLDLDWLREVRQPTGGHPRRRFMVNPKVVKDAGH